MKNEMIIKAPPKPFPYKVGDTIIVGKATYSFKTSGSNVSGEFLLTAEMVEEIEKLRKLSDHIKAF